MQNKKAVSAKRLQGKNLSAPDTANISITHTTAPKFNSIQTAIFSTKIHKKT